MIVKLNVAFPVVETTDYINKTYAKKIDNENASYKICLLIRSLWLKPQAILIKHKQMKKHSLRFEPQERNENRQQQYKP